MNKWEAEQILGLQKAYMYKDVTKSYRVKIKTAHPDTGGSTEEAARLNAAKEFMDGIFANDKNAVLSAETSEPHEDSIYEGSTYRKSSQATWNEESSDYSAQQEEDPFSEVWSDEFWDSFIQQEEEPNHEARNETSSSSHVRKKEQYVAWWEVAYGKNEKQSPVITNGTNGLDEKPDGPIPWWYKLSDFMVRKFPWKTSLVLIFFAYFSLFIPYVMGGYTPLTTFILYALFGAAVVNAITGCFTDSFRKAIRFHADNALFRWQEKREV